MTPDFHGLPARSLENDHLRVDYLVEAGPRLVRLIPAGSADNLLAEVPDVRWPTPWGDYHLRGGHRLAIAPEALELSYVPDAGDLIVEEMPGGVRLVRPTETGSGVSKSLEIQLQPDRPALTLRHAVRNDRSAPIELAAWAITQYWRWAALPLRRCGPPPLQIGTGPIGTWCCGRIRRGGTSDCWSTTTTSG